MGLVSIVILAAILLFVLFLIIYIWGRMLRKVGPNQALIISSGRKVNVVTGGSQFVVPLFQRVQELSLELMSFDVAPPQDLYTTQGVATSKDINSSESSWTR